MACQSGGTTSWGGYRVWDCNKWVNIGGHSVHNLSDLRHLSAIGVQVVGTKWLLQRWAHVIDCELFAVSTFFRHSLVQSFFDIFLLNERKHFSRLKKAISLQGGVQLSQQKEEWDTSIDSLFEKRLPVRESQYFNIKLYNAGVCRQEIDRFKVPLRFFVQKRKTQISSAFVLRVTTLKPSSSPKGSLLVST